MCWSRTPSSTNRKPEILLYEPQADGTLRLVGMVLDSGQDAAPRILGHTFQGPMTHAWTVERNPRGTFAQYNPNVGCP